MKPNQENSTMKMLKVKAMELGSSYPGLQHLAAAMLLLPEGRSALAKHLNTDEHLLYKPDRPVGSNEHLMKASDFIWPTEILAFCNPKLDESELMMAELDMLSGKKNNNKSKNLKFPQEVGITAYILTELLPRQAWFPVQTNPACDSPGILKVTDALSVKWPHLTNFYNKLGQMFIMQLQCRSIGHAEPVFYYSSRRDVAVLDQFALQYTGRKLVILDESGNKFSQLRKTICELESGSIVIFRMAKFNENDSQRSALLNALNNEVPDNLGEDDLFYKHPDGSIRNLLSEHLVIVQVMVPEHLTNEFILSVHEFKQILASTFEEEATDFFSFKSNQLEEMQKFLRLSTPANSLTQANVDLERFFSLYMTECFEAYHELTGDIEFQKISKDDLVHLAAMKMFAQRLVHVMPETKVLMFKQVVRHIMALTEGLNKSYKVKIIAGKEFDNSTYPEGDALMSYYAENFADLVREQRVKPFHTQIDVAGSLILIREDPAESERVNPLPNATPVSYILKDVAGMDEVKQIFQMLLLGLQEPEKFVALDVHPLHNLLLYGPPGSGKTYIVKAFANEAGIPFFYKSATKSTGSYTPEQEQPCCATSCEKPPTMRHAWYFLMKLSRFQTAKSIARDK